MSVGVSLGRFTLRATPRRSRWSATVRRWTPNSRARSSNERPCWYAAVAASISEGVSRRWTGFAGPRAAPSAVGESTLSTSAWSALEPAVLAIGGQHSIPGSRALRADVDSVDSPTADGAARGPAKPLQRRLTPSEIEAATAAYQHGRSLDDLAREFGVHRRTVADHLERLGVARRVNLPKLTPTDIERAVSQYQAGDSLATVGRILNVDASTVQRALKRAGVAIRPRRGRWNS